LLQTFHSTLKDSNVSLVFKNLGGGEFFDAQYMPLNAVLEVATLLAANMAGITSFSKFRCVVFIHFLITLQTVFDGEGDFTPLL